MSEASVLANNVERAIAGPMWHGPAVGELLREVSAAEAGARPVPGAHSVWELVLHIAAWAEIARERIAGRAPGEATAEQDWPPVSAQTAAAWSDAVLRLGASHRALARDVAALDVDGGALASIVPGRQYSVSALVHGVIEHTTYHGGQIAILKRAVAADPSRSV
jgi:uncharacterized damage-inducible protein DinB